MLSETKIINHLQKNFAKQANLLGIGDDASVFPFSKNISCVISKDLLVEDIHFCLAYSSAKDIARKALQVNLSDIAAMGAKAKYVLLGLSLPHTTSKQWIKDFTQAFSHDCQSEKVTLIGGDTTASVNKIFISVTILGFAPTQQIKIRQRAKQGDAICIVGDLGKSYLGLIALEKNLKEFSQYKQKSLKPQAKTQEGLWLGKQTSVHAMMDISDGLSLDLQRLCHASQVGASIDCFSLLPDNKFLCTCKQLSINPWQAIFAGGEDYALLFTVAANQVSALQKRFNKKFNNSFLIIGKVTKRKNIHLKNSENLNINSFIPFSHFGENDVA